MQTLNILVTSNVDSEVTYLQHGETQLLFKKISRISEIPVLDGRIWAFIDWMLPEISGLELCRQLRCSPITASAHVTIVLEDDDDDAKRRALRAGADDYVHGPVSQAQIVDRVSSTGQISITPSSTVQLGDLTIELSAHRVRWQGRQINLKPNEFRLLRFLAERPGRVFTRAQLIAGLGKQDLTSDERTVNVWVGRLRRSLDSAGAGDMLRTVRSLGYVLDLPDAKS